MPVSKRDDYIAFCEEIDPVITSFKKDDALIKNRIKISTYKFSNEVKITYPPSLDGHACEIIEKSDDHTLIKINGYLIGN